jgi:hypothetical protein
MNNATTTQRIFDLLESIKPAPAFYELRSGKPVSATGIQAHIKDGWSSVTFTVKVWKHPL